MVEGGRLFHLDVVLCKAELARSASESKAELARSASESNAQARRPSSLKRRGEIGHLAALTRNSSSDSRSSSSFGGWSAVALYLVCADVLRLLSRALVEERNISASSGDEVVCPACQLSRRAARTPCAGIASLELLLCMPSEPSFEVRPICESDFTPNDVDDVASGR